MRNAPIAAPLLSVQHRYRRLQKLCGEVMEITKLDGEGETYRKLVEVPVKILGLESACLILVDKYDRGLYGVARKVRGRKANSPPLDLTDDERKGARAALRRGRTLVTSSMPDREKSGSGAGRRDREPGTAFVPLLSRGIPFGLLILRARSGGTWMKDDIELAVHFSGLATVAIENAKLLNRLAETEERLRSLIEHIPAIVYTCEVEPPYSTIYVSPQIERILGYTPEQFTHHRGFIEKIMHPKDWQRVQDYTEDARARRRGFASIEYRVRDRWGEYRWLRDEMVLVRGPSDDPLAWHGVIVEITSLKRPRDRDRDALRVEASLESGIPVHSGR